MDMASKATKLLGAVVKPITGDEDDSYDSNDDEDGEFPVLYRYLPRFWTVGVENGKINPEPLALSIYKPSFKGKWILIVSFPGVKAPYGSWSVKQVMAKAAKFKERNCLVFLLSTDTWSLVRQYRNNIENKTSKATGKHTYDVEGVTFLVDQQGKLCKRLDVLCEPNSGSGYEPMCYPGYFLLTPDKELVQFCVLKDNTKMYERDDKTYFAYPINEEVVSKLLESLEALTPIYDVVKKLKVTYPRATFGTFMENMIRLVQSDKEDQKESIFKWRGWTDSFGGVLGGGLK